MAEHNRLGNWGEQLVADHLVAQGYAIAERNWRLNHLELDIIATRGDEIVFVGVKTRRDTAGNPLDAMTPRKIRNLAAAADAYLRSRNIRLRPRFDVAAVTGDPHTHTLTYLPNAFYPPLRTFR